MSMSSSWHVTAIGGELAVGAAVGAVVVRGEASTSSSVGKGFVRHSGADSERREARPQSCGCGAVMSVRPSG